MDSLLKMLRHLKPYKKAAILAPLFMILEVMMDLSQPMLLKRAVDIGIAGNDFSYIVKTGLTMLVLAIIGLAGGMLCAFFSAKAALNMGTDIREKLFRKIQSLSFSDLDRFNTGHLITRLTNDVTQVQHIVMMMLRVLVRVPMLIIGSLIMAFITSRELSVIIAAIVPLMVISVALVMRKAFPLFSSVQSELDNVNKIVQENLSGIRVVKSFVRSNFENERFKVANDSFMNKMIEASRVVATEIPIIMLFLNMGIVAVIYVGGVSVIDGTLHVGQIIAFVNYLVIMLTSLMMLAMILVQFSRSEVSAERIQEVLEINPTVLNKTDSSEEGIEKGEVIFDNVSFDYDSHFQEPVLKKINFKAKPGETIAILGATGSGKSTLINLIPRFYDISQGKITIDGKDIKEINLSSLRKDIGVVMQQSTIFSGSIEENISFGRPGASKEEIIEAAKAAQAHEFISKLPDKYDTILGQKGVNLSGGQKQRISIARALIAKPKVLILDDSTSAVDATTETYIQEALKKIMKDTTNFIVAQRISTVLEADKIIVMDNGEIVAMGTHSELIEKCSIYRDIYISQLGGEGIAE